MTPEEQRDVTIKCGISIGCDQGDIWYYAVYPDELAAYTAAVEAKERERCLAKCEIVRNIYIDQGRPARDTALLCAATCDCESAIRSLK